MIHKIYRVVSFDRIEPFILRVVFDDGSAQVIDFRPVLEGDLYGPLQNPNTFNQVEIDSEAHTLVWPNGADFDPATLHDWPETGPALKLLAEKWAARNGTQCASS
ncbi:MAG: DUF2442 domain-containing protein [Deltaproteobacteria bacterium]|nr:DUF2442 domain-containing protein [Deltaproteobacteria bacterium]